MQCIDSFSGQYRFLSNFWPAKVSLEGQEFPSVEHAYVAAKTTDKEIRSTISALAKPGDAKRFGRTLKIREDWDAVKLSVMTDLVRQKFNHPELTKKLMDTRGIELIEGNTWGDTFWGVCNGRGQNHLGEILMSIRDKHLFREFE